MYYTDSKDLPLYNYKRIIDKGDFLYMVKGYEGGGSKSLNKEDAKKAFEEAVKDYALNINSVNSDIVEYGTIEYSKQRILLYLTALQVVENQMLANEIRTNLGMDISNEIVEAFLAKIKIPRRSDLMEQAILIKDKIEKLQNEISGAIKRLEKQKVDEGESDTDIDEVIINVALILEYQIDERNTSLYQFGILQKQARSKVEQIAKMNSKNK